MYCFFPTQQCIFSCLKGSGRLGADVINKFQPNLNQALCFVKINHITCSIQSECIH